MLHGDYLKEVAALKADKSILNYTRGTLLGLMPQSKFDELIVKMQGEENWESKSLIIFGDNCDKVFSTFTNYSETYAGQNANYGRVDTVLFSICSKSHTKHGDIVMAYKKDANLNYESYDNGSTFIKPTGFHPNHSLIWVIKTNNKVAGDPDKTFYGEGIEYVIYVYTPSAEVRKNCHLIKLRKELANKPAFDQIAAIREKAEKEIAAIKVAAGIKD